MRLIRTLILLTVLFTLLMGGGAVADSSIMATSTEKVGMLTKLDKSRPVVSVLHSGDFSIYNPHKQLLDKVRKIKHDLWWSRWRAHLKNVAIRKEQALKKQREAVIASQAVRTQSEQVKPVYQNTSGNTYTPGYCTWGVKDWRPNIPNGWHNASNWLYAAQSSGFATGSVPRLGAVGVAGDHVVLVVSVAPLLIKEMNYAGLYSVRIRPATASEFRYIY